MHGNGRRFILRDTRVQLRSYVLESIQMHLHLVFWSRALLCLSLMPTLSLPLVLALVVYPAPHPHTPHVMEIFMEAEAQHTLGLCPVHLHKRNVYRPGVMKEQELRAQGFSRSSQLAQMKCRTTSMASLRKSFATCRTKRTRRVASAERQKRPSADQCCEWNCCA